MIGIRSITYNLGEEKYNSRVEKNIKECASLWQNAWMIHTQRINFSDVYGNEHGSRLKKILPLCDISPVRWINCPLNEKYFDGDVFAQAHKLLTMSDRTFVNIIGVEHNEINEHIFRRYADLKKKVGKMDNTGVNNFRLGLSFNVGHDCPFFPFTRASEGKNSFSIALEMVEEINNLLNCKSFEDLSTIKTTILQAIGEQVSRIEEIAENFSQQVGLEFAGFDFSLAPVISPDGSILAMLRELGVYNFGAAGTMFATAYLTDILKELATEYKSIGFSGVMYSLLEDLELCTQNNERAVTVEQLISLSTMCGCGLDMVPVGWDVKEEEIATLCRDVAAVSCRYNKPLGVRLLPIPGTTRDTKGKTAITGEADFIANTKLVPLDVNVLYKQCDGFYMRDYKNG